MEFIACNTDNIWTDGKTYRCKSDTAHSPADYAEAWEETIK